MELNCYFFAFIVAAVALLPGCERHRQPANGPIAHDVLSTQIEAAASSTEDAPLVTVPVGTGDFWIIAMPYNLEENCAKLNLRVSAGDKDRLIQANVANECVLVARIANERVATINVLGPQFAASPSTFAVHSGDSLTLQRREESRPILIVKGTQ